MNTALRAGAWTLPAPSTSVTEGSGRVPRPLTIAARMSSSSLTIDSSWHLVRVPQPCIQLLQNDISERMSALGSQVHQPRVLLFDRVPSRTGRRCSVRRSRRRRVRFDETTYGRNNGSRAYSTIHSKTGACTNLTHYAIGTASVGPREKNVPRLTGRHVTSQSR